MHRKRLGTTALKHYIGAPLPVEAKVYNDNRNLWANIRVLF